MERSSRARLVVLATGTVLTLSLFVSNPARAQNEQLFSFLGVNAVGTLKQQISISDNSSSSFTAIQVGRYRGSFNGGTTAFNVFCTDLHHGVRESGDSFDTLALLGKTTDPFKSLLTSEGFYKDPGPSGTPGGMISGLDTVGDYNPGTAGQLIDFNTNSKRVSSAAWLGHTYLNDAGLTAANAAAVQLALWDIVQDGGDGVGAGQFRATLNGTQLTAFQTIVNLAKLHNAFTSPLDDTDYIQAERMTATNGEPDATHPALPGNHKQEFMYAPVPEPVFYQLGALLGMGGIGLMRAHRRKSRC